MKNISKKSYTFFGSKNTNIATCMKTSHKGEDLVVLSHRCKLSFILNDRAQEPPKVAFLTL